MVGPPDDIGDSLAASAVELVRQWLAAGEGQLSRRERHDRRRFQLLTGDERSLAFTMAFCDRVLRPEDPAVAAAQLRAVSQGPAPPFLSPSDRLLLSVGSRLARLAPQVVMPLTRRRLRQLVGGLVVDSSDAALSRHLKALREQGFAVNVNLLGEYVLGDLEASRRLEAIKAVINRSDVDYVSVKASAVASQLNLWGYDHTLTRVMDALRLLYLAAAQAIGGPKFLNLDMEEYSDLQLTVDAFTRLLDEPELRSLDAGIVLQAYLPDSFDVLREIVGWAADRQRDGNTGTVKIRIVKGANLAMESVDAELHGWQRAAYSSKHETDCNYKRMLDWTLDPQRLATVRIGVASHNLFDVAWAFQLARSRGVGDRVEMEMLQGMAPGVDRAVRDATGGVRLYTPVVAAADFDSALAYLFRRLEENSQGENFLRSSFDLTADPGAFAAEQDRFVASLAGRWQVASGPRRRALPAPPADAGFHNSPDTDTTDPDARGRILRALSEWEPSTLPREINDVAGIDEVLEAATETALWWNAQPPEVRRKLLHSVAVEIAANRPELLAVMAHEAQKTLSEGDGEVSEAADMAAYYAEQIPGLRGENESEAVFLPLGVVLVTPPWNFPLAITAGGVLAALAAGNVVVLKPAPQTPHCALAVAEAVWAACRERRLPTNILQYVRCPEEVVGEHLVAHPSVQAIVLTGARATSELFHRLAPETSLFAETSGKNALVVMPDADLDLAAADLVHSAFGHAGQKCSAASLAICVGDVYASERFRRKLVDAASSLITGPADDPATALAPLIGPAAGPLFRALTQLDPGESWLLTPLLLDGARGLWSPGIKAGVKAGSWFHQTECFGPVLGLMPAADLDEALSLQNSTPFGLTGGIHTLDPQTADEWLERVEVGNAYINRVITGAVVRRQPFGGWKGSVVGPGAKAGGPNYVSQLGHWTDGELPTRGLEPSSTFAEHLTSTGEILGPGHRRWLEAALRSDEWCNRHHFAVGHDPSALSFEANIFRYRPLGRVVIWASEDARPVDILRTRFAAVIAGCDVEIVAWPGPGDGLPDVTVTRNLPALVERWLADPPARVRVLGTRPEEFGALRDVCFVDSRPVVADGLVEGLRYRREQAVSRTLHRFGNVIREREA